VTTIILIALFITTVIVALVAFGYFRAPEIRPLGESMWRQMSPSARRAAGVLGHVVVFGLWTAFQYELMLKHYAARDWQFYFSLTVVVLWAYLTIKRIVRTLTSSDESFGSGTHA
jgi:hypothetical protein